MPEEGDAQVVWRRQWTIPLSTMFSPARKPHLDAVQQESSSLSRQSAHSRLEYLPSRVVIVVFGEDLIDHINLAGHETQPLPRTGNFGMFWPNMCATGCASIQNHTLVFRSSSARSGLCPSCFLIGHTILRRQSDLLHQSSGRSGAVFCELAGFKIKRLVFAWRL